MPVRQTPEDLCEALAARQCGVISRDEALRAGMSARSISARTGSGRWHVMHPRVYVPRPVPASWQTELMGALKWAGEGAVVSHRAAAQLWELDGLGSKAAEISMPSSGRRPGVTAHRFDADDPPESAFLGGWPITTVERTFLDLAANVRPFAIGSAMDAALQRRITSLDRLAGLVERQGRQGRKGTKTLRRLIELRTCEFGLVESTLEADFLRLLRTASLPLPETQFPVIENGAFIARLDFAYPHERIAIETHGYRWHSSPDRWRADLRRQNQLRTLGWIVYCYSWDDVHFDGDRVVREITAALAQRNFSRVSTSQVLSLEK